MFYIMEKRTGKYLVSAEDCIRLTENLCEKDKKFKDKRSAKKYMRENHLSDFIVVDD